ncbi:MAG: SH3 domain-containing protein [Caldilineaceae bacterium]|nr:SH3 domain-containing protein [Caldilineaceae bacterium]
MIARTHTRLFLSLGLFVLLVGFSVLPAARPLLAQVEDLPAAGVVIAEDSLLRVRGGPGTTFAIVTRLEPGAQVQVLAVSDDGAWYQISAGGTQGWASAEFVRVGVISPSAPAASTAVAGVTPSAAPNAARRADGPAAPVGAVALLAPVTNPTAAVPTATPIVSAEDGTFVLLPTPTPRPAGAQADAQNGAAPLLAVTSAPAVIPTAAPAVGAPAATPDVPTAYPQPARMNVRGGPGTHFAILTSVAGGTPLAITGKTGDSQWYRVSVDGQAEPGWLFAGLTRTAGPMESVAVLAPEDLPQPPAAEAAVSTDAQAVAAPVAAAPVVAAPPPAGGGFFGYGVQAHMLAGETGSALGAINDMGFNWVKQQVEWRLFQPQPGAVGFGDLHGIVSEAGNRGISVLFSVVNAPEWAREPGFDGGVGGPPADPQTYAAFVGGMAGQFCNSALKAIEVWNEQNLHYEWGNKPLDPAEYMRLLAASYAAIKAACPSMLVISGALTPAGSNPPFAVDDFAYLEGMYQNGLANYADGIGAHPSGYNVPAGVGWEQACATIQQTVNSFNGACDTPHHSWSFRSTLEGYRNIMMVYGDGSKRIWPTEFGWAAGGAFDPRYAYANDNSFDEQAAWTVEAYTMMRDWGWVGPAFLWNLNFRVVADGTEKAQWGIVRNDYSPLPVYQALKAMAK